MTRRQVALIGWVMMPLVVLAVLVGAIASSLKNPPKKFAPVGAGAGDTGGANGIGEAIAHRMHDNANSAAIKPTALAADADEMVAPESLEQGFILVVEDKAKRATVASPIYLAGNVNGWNAGDEAFKLTPQSDMKWRFVFNGKPKLPDNEKRMEFKFTRGSWDYEELKDDMSAPGNRTLPMLKKSEIVAGEAPKIEMSVSHWGDERPDFAAKRLTDPYRKIEVTGTLKRLQVSDGAATAAGMSRDVLVWLPPGYNDAKNAAKSYPVIYMHDGQNVFEKLPTTPGEWQADETAQKLITDGLMAPVIIVGIPHSGAGRRSEYMPVEGGFPDIKAEGARHVAWVMSEVMPRVERAFRVAKGPENTAIGGSSMGAVISVYAAAEHPETFGMLLAESLPLQTGNAEVWQKFVEGVKRWPAKTFLGMGSAEYGNGEANAKRNATLVEKVKALESTIVGKTGGSDHVKLVIGQGAEHTESAWADRLDEAFVYLFPGKGTPMMTK
jgi:enterochelin esterase-like enzyme